MANADSIPSSKIVNLKKVKKNASCGLVMPISAINGCPAEHWEEVKSIIVDAVEAIKTPKFTVKLVSDADDVGIIQKRIVQNIYSSEIVVCDLSGRNPNVMFELGMRLAFDKPVVIIKDDKTEYLFDTGIIEHITYPRDLRFSQIVDFKKILASKVLATYKASTTKPDQSPFLRNFGKFPVMNQGEVNISPDNSLPDSFFARKALISKTQRDILEYIEYKKSVKETDIRSKFSNISETELFYRLEQLRLLGFIEQGKPGKAGVKIFSQIYRSSKKYQDEKRKTLGFHFLPGATITNAPPSGYVGFPRRKK